MSESNFIEYNSPNIVIVPTKSLSDDPPHKHGSGAVNKSSTDDTNKSIPILIQRTTSKSDSCTNVDSNANMNANRSWASNYLQSIGLFQEKTILNCRGNMNTGEDKVMFLNQNPPPVVGPHQYANVNLQTAAPNTNCAYGPSSSNHENNANFHNYKNIVSSTGVMSATSYMGSYENNNYYYSQPMHTAESGCCLTCYSTAESISNPYLNTYGQTSNVLNNTSSMTTYYDTTATSTLAPAVNLPYTETHSFINTPIVNNFSQSLNITDVNASSSITPYQDNRCPTPLIDENLLTPQSGTCMIANSSVTKITDVKTSDMNDKKLSSVSYSTAREKKCDCMCAKRISGTDGKENTENQINTDKKIEQMSSVQANEMAFREFLRKLKIDRSSEKEKKLTPLLKSPLKSKKVKKSKENSKDKSSVQENEKAFRKLLQKLKMERNSKTEKSDNKQVIRKSTSSKVKTSNQDNNIASSEDKSSKVSKQIEEERPKFIKTKYVDEQEPQYKPIKKARLEHNFELEKYSKTKIITTKYIDKQGPDYKYLKKSKLDCYETKKYCTTKSKPTKYLDEREFDCKPAKQAKHDIEYESKKYSKTKTIPTKYVDKEEPEYKPVIKQRNSNEYELKRYSKTKTFPAKYVDNKKDEYKHVKKSKIDCSSELPKRTTKFDSTNFKRLRDESDMKKITDCKKYDSDYKIRTYKTESTKYYKYRTDNNDEIHKQTPVKSIVKISKTHELKKSPLNNILAKEDLRDKLRRKLTTENEELKEENIIKSKSSNESIDDNLIITVNNNISENTISPINIIDNLKTKRESSKKINLVINIVYKQPGSSRSESDKSDSDGHSPQANADVSFLDDFNVDEIVASLNKSEVSNVTTSGEIRIKKTDTSKDFINRENSGLDSEKAAKIILEKGDVLNNLLSKEASILDSLRIIHEEIQHEKRSCMANEQNELFPEMQNELTQKVRSSTHAMLEKNIENESVINKSKLSPKELKSSAENNTSSLSALMEHLNKIGYTKDLSEPVNYGLLKEETEILTENDINSYDHDTTSFVEEDKRRQSELLKILQDTKEDEQGVIQTQTNILVEAHATDEVSSDNNTYDNDINCFEEEDKRRQSELLKILQDTKEDEIGAIQIQTNNTLQATKGLDEILNNMNTVNDGFTSSNKEDKNLQRELLKILEGTKEDGIKVFQKHTNHMYQTKHVLDKVSNEPTVIDLSSDESNDSCKTKQSNENSLDDVYIVEEKSGKNYIETIDLTTNENVSKQISTRIQKTMGLYNKESKIDCPMPAVKENRNTVTVKLANVQEKNVYTKKHTNTKDTGKGITTEIVTAIKDAIDALRTNESLNEGYINKENKAKDRKVSNNQDGLKQSPSDAQPSKKIKSISMEDKESAPVILTKDFEDFKEDTFVSATNFENISDIYAEKEHREIQKENHMRLKEDCTMEPIDNRHTIKSKSLIANNTKIEETVPIQAELNVEDEKSSYTDVKFDKSVSKTSTEVHNTVQTTKEDGSSTIPDTASCNKQKVNDTSVKNVVDSKTEVGIKERTNEGKSIKANVQNKTEAPTLKTTASTSGAKINNPLPAIKKDNHKAVDQKVENTNKKSLFGMDKKMSIIAGKLEREMFQCFNQKYIAQGLIHSGMFSKVFHFASYSGRRYAVKSYNDWNTTFKHAEKKDMLFALQEGLTRQDYGCVFLINSFTLQSRLCLLMDYYPKNLKQALVESERPFHISVVQHLGRQLVSAVMQLKSHDIVHLDIKPTHILLSHNSDRLKLCGFDAARYINKIPILPTLGTVNYRPPEVIIGYKVGFDVDVWSTALVMYEMATDIQLFPGTQNNDILFKQICTLGALPIEMIHRSHFSNAHFTGNSFKRAIGYNQNNINIITKFYKNTRLEKTIINAYNDNWRSTATQQGLAADKEKIMSLTALLRDMLEVDPGDRMPIQFVNAHPFITDEL